MRGLFLLVQPTGAKSFAVRYSRAGRVMKVTLGPYPLPLSLVDARRRALGIAASVANGADPAEEKKAARKAAARVPDTVKTVRTIADEFFDGAAAADTGGAAAPNGAVAMSNKHGWSRQGRHRRLLMRPTRPCSRGR